MDVKYLVNQQFDSYSELLNGQIAIQYVDSRFYQRLSNQGYARCQHFDYLKYHECLNCSYLQYRKYFQHSHILQRQYCDQLCNSILAERNDYH